MVDTYNPLGRLGLRPVWPPIARSQWKGRKKEKEVGREGEEEGKKQMRKGKKGESEGKEKEKRTEHKSTVETLLSMHEVLGSISSHIKNKVIGCLSESR